MVSHHGLTARTGHYVADVFRSEIFRGIFGSKHFILNLPKVSFVTSFKFPSLKILPSCFRYDVGAWLRYDDQRVSSTSLEAVTSGSNTYNGYILTYCQSPLWRRLRNNTVSDGFI